MRAGIGQKQSVGHPPLLLALSPLLRFAAFPADKRAV
jgi:hypothetical protein